jgi:DHA2 family multidrug resistance protein-like MFS transporter
MVPQSLVMLAGTLLAPRLAQRFDTVGLVAGGLAVAGVGLMMLGLLDTDSLALHLVAMVVAAGGVSIPMALVVNLIMGATPPERAGSAGSLMEMCGELGIAMGVATLGTLVAALYRFELPGRLPSGISHEAATTVGQGVTTAPAAADQSPVLSDQILAAAQSAFTEAYNVVGVLGGIALVATALVARRVLAAPAAPGTDWVDDLQLDLQTDVA